MFSGDRGRGQGWEQNQLPSSVKKKGAHREAVQRAPAISRQRNPVVCVYGCVLLQLIRDLGGEKTVFTEVKRLNIKTLCLGVVFLVTSGQEQRQARRKIYSCSFAQFWFVSECY